MQHHNSSGIFDKAVKLLYIAAAIVFAFWFAYEAVAVLFLFFFAVVLTLVLNAPVMWLVKRNIPRTVAALLVFFAMLLFLGLIGYLVVPKVLEQASAVINNIPTYYTDLKGQLSRLLADYPSLQDKLLSSSNIQESLPSMMQILQNVGKYSFSIVGAVFLLVMFFSIVLYMLIKPKPLIEMYLQLFKKEKRGKAAHALARASTMMVGWMWSNLVVGSMEAVAVFIFLSYMGVPGVWIWVGLALFAEMVPKLGLYIMAIPPVLISLSLDPMTALWVLIFYLVLNEIMGDLVMPRVRASTMDLHPVSSLFVMLAMASVFGLLGALIATPLTAFIKAYYEEFFLTKGSEKELQQEVDVVLNRKS